MNFEQDNPVINSRFIKPQHEWGWQVALDLYLAGMGAGSLIMGLLMDWLGYSPYSSRVVLLWGPVLVALGALILVMKLGIKRRFPYTILNPRTSWLSRGFYILSGCIIFGLINLLISILPYFDINISEWSSYILVIDIISFIFAIGVSIYTGILIKSVKYISLWNTILLPALFTVSAFTGGSMLVVFSAYIYDLLVFQQGYSSQMMNVLVNIQLVFIIVEAICAD